mgnify:CR=1 FL=1
MNPSIDHKSNTKRVLSGIRATGTLHLGNYLGAVKGMIELQDDPGLETYYMVADLHTLTTPYDAASLDSSTKNVMLDYLAAGLNPQKTTLFAQSMVPEHTELAFLFSTVTTMAKMQHLPTFKDKVKQHSEHVTMALLNYPVLMASDILVYKADLVPVGIDQEPHIEVTREIARRFNQDYGNMFPEPHRFATAGEYIPSLTGEGKMSKSVEGSAIALTDDKDLVRKKIRSIPTATTAGGEKTGGVAALFTLLKLYLPNELSSFEQKYDDGSLRFVELKDTISEAISHSLTPHQVRRKEIMETSGYLETVMREGAEKARETASQTLVEAKKAMGLVTL